MEGYEVLTALDGEQALEKARAEHPDLIVLDIMMDTDAEGFNLAYKLKEREATKKIPIVIVSGYPQHLKEKMDKFEFILGRDWPAAAQMEKPINLKELATTIGRVLG
jgi:DNA-binding response OmpR family regulator